MKLPKKLKIGGHVFDVIYPYEFPDSSSTGAMVFPEENVIKISSVTLNKNPKSESCVWVTIIHEVLHALDQFSMHKIFDEVEFGEEKCECLAQGLYQVLVDNDLLKFPK